jgi:hypothetical protein
MATVEYYNDQIDPYNTYHVQMTRQTSRSVEMELVLRQRDSLKSTDHHVIKAKGQAKGHCPDRTPLVMATVTDGTLSFMAYANYEGKDKQYYLPKRIASYEEPRNRPR